MSPQVAYMNNMPDIYARPASKNNYTYTVVIGLLVIIVIAFLVQKDNFPYQIPLPSFISSMKGVIGIHKKDAFCDNVDNLVNLTYCAEDDETCKGKTNEAKKKYTEIVQKFCDETSDYVMMIYAPWCPHCHKAMPNLNEAAKNISQKVALVNADLVERHILQNKNMEVTHFPFIVHVVDGNAVVMSEAPSQQNIENFARNTVPDASAPVAKEAEVAEDPLQMMFE